MSGRRANRTKSSPPPTAAPPETSRWAQFLFEPVSNNFLVYFRISFGLLMLGLGWHHYSHGMIDRYFIEPPVHFTYYGFDWVRPWPDFGHGQSWLDVAWISHSPGNGVYCHFVLLGLLSVMIVLGLCYRASALLFCLGFTHVFLIERARYLNHFYLIILVSFVLVLVPAHQAFSLDAWLRPKLRSRTAPAWTLRLLQFQIGIVYFFAGIAKCNGFWISGERIRGIMAARAQVSDFDWIGHLFTKEHLFTQDWLIHAMSWGGLLFDLAVYPLLLWRKTRIFALVLCVMFHTMNSQIFFIDVFPWMMLASTVILFFSDWLPPRDVKSADDRSRTSANVVLPNVTLGQKILVGISIVFVAIQLLLPLRPFFYAGDPGWTSEGYQFSWRMLTRTFRAGPPVFVARYRTPDGELKTDDQLVSRDPELWRRHWQFRKILRQPDMLLQFAHTLAEDLRRQGNKDVEIRVAVYVSFNGRRPQPFVDSNVDLAKEPRRFLTPYPWIRELQDSPTGR